MTWYSPSETPRYIHPKPLRLEVYCALFTVLQQVIHHVMCNLNPQPTQVLYAMVARPILFVMGQAAPD